MASFRCLLSLRFIQADSVWLRVNQWLFYTRLAPDGPCFHLPGAVPRLIAVEPGESLCVYACCRDQGLLRLYVILLINNNNLRLSVGPPKGGVFAKGDRFIWLAK
jgi:hypothetical protein